jgi:peptide/nickel transport system permease protein
MSDAVPHLPRALVVLAVLHLAALLGEAIAPCSPREQVRELAYAPPTRLHFIDASGRWLATPFVYGARFEGGALREDPRHAFPVRLFARGASYRLADFVPADRHLVGVEAPGRLFLLGTDRYGRDVFSRLVVGARLSLFAGLLATLLAIGLGATIGALSGFFGGPLDAVLSWLTNVCLSLPLVYLLLAARSLLPLDMDPAHAFAVTAALIGAVAWGRPALLVRAVVRAERGRDYVLSARACGATPLRLLWRHVAPQATGVLVTQAALLAPRSVLAEITLSFLGLGVSEPAASWGTLAAGMVPPGIVMSHWWLAAPLAAIVALFALYDRVARDLEALPAVGRLVVERRTEAC